MTMMTFRFLTGQAMPDRSGDFVRRVGGVSAGGFADGFWVPVGSVPLWAERKRRVWNAICRKACIHAAFSVFFRSGTDGTAIPSLSPLRGEEREGMPAASIGGLPMTDDEKSAWLRANLPVVAKVVDEFSAVYGRDGIRVVYAAEAGHELGKRSPDGVSLADTLVGPLARKAVK